MTMAEYQYIVNIINNNTYERMLYLEIERHVRNALGTEIAYISYQTYVEMRNRLDAVNRVKISQTAELISEGKSGRVKNKKKAKKPPSIGMVKFAIVLVIITILVVVYILLPSHLKHAFLVLAIIGVGYVVYLMIPGNAQQYSDYVSKSIKAHEEARINTEAYISQAILHKEQLRELNKMIENRQH